MDGVLSQEEISALLNNPDDANKNDLLTKTRLAKLVTSAWEQRQQHCFPL